MHDIITLTWERDPHTLIELSKLLASIMLGVSSNRTITFSCSLKMAN